MGNDSMIFIRTDGNSSIATGHFVRCLCIAQSLRALGKEICFLVSDSESRLLLEKLIFGVLGEDISSFQIRVLETAVFPHMEKELKELVSLLRETACTDSNNKKRGGESPLKPVVLIDSYYVTPFYLDSLGNYAKTVYLDDLRSFDYKVDLIVNYDVIPKNKQQDYLAAYSNARKSLLGAEYAPLRPQFQNQTVFLRDQVTDVFLSTGGSDPYHFTTSLLTSLMESAFQVDFHVVVGLLFSNKEELENLSRRFPSIHLYYNVQNMAELMKKCDVAIAAAGTTLYELCALGIPAVSFTMSDNQLTIAEAFSGEEVVFYAGDIRKGSLPIINTLKDKLQYFLSSYSHRCQQHKQMQRMVDGNGSMKIAEEIIQL